MPDEPWVYDGATIGGIPVTAFSLTLKSPPPLDWKSIDLSRPGPVISGTATITFDDRELYASALDPRNAHTVELTRSWTERRAGWRGWVDWLLRRRPVHRTLITSIPDVQFAAGPEPTPLSGTIDR